MDLSKIKFIGWLLMVLGFVLMVISIILPLPDNSVFVLAIGIPGIVFLALGYIVFVIFWKCPSCHRHLPLQIGMGCCPYCGETLDK